MKTVVLADYCLSSYVLRCKTLCIAVKKQVHQTTIIERFVSMSSRTTKKNIGIYESNQKLSSFRDCERRPDW